MASSENQWSPTEWAKLQQILEELQQLTEPSEMPQAIRLCETALGLVSRDHHPELWAWLQFQLGSNCIQDIMGNRAQNLERAIEHSKQALEVYTHQYFPEQWAATQNNLAVAYRGRVKGDRTQNLERVIEHLKQALEVYTRPEFSQEWAMTQNNLAAAYWERTKGDRAQNLERAIEHYEQALEVDTREDFPEAWAAIQNDLANVYLHRIREVRAENLEEAIHHCAQALDFFTRQDFPEQWAAAQNNLANAYSDRIRGDRAENLEKAIECYEKALIVRTRDDFSEQWAMIQNNLANAYSHRIKGDGAQNLERAIEHSKQALQVYTRQDFPQDWAMAQNNWANAYSDRIRGDRAENLERAIRHHERALEVYTRQGFSEQWASTQNNLASVYSDRIRGDRAENLERAIEHSKRALGIYTRQSFPQDWAMTQNNLANIYSDRIRGDRAENLERAIEHYEQALQIYTPEDFPQDWAATQNNLAAAYADRIEGDRADNLERAIEHYEQALLLRRPDSFPQDWAATQNNVGTAYSDRVKGDRAVNTERALEHYGRALEVYTRQDFPERWAMAQSNLANAYWERTKGDRAENLERAIEHYERALQIYTPQEFPQDCRNTAFALANLLYDERRYIEARRAFTTAHEAVEALRGEIQREEARRELAEQNAVLYARLVYCCLVENDEEIAFEYAAAGKGRAFVDLLATARFDPSAAGTKEPQLAEDLHKARELRQHIANLMAQLTGRGTLPTTITSYAGQPLDKVHTELLALQDEHDRLWEDMSFNYPALTATQRAPILSADEARKLAAELGAALVEYYEHANGWSAFVITPEEVRHVPLPEADEELMERIFKWLSRIESPAGRGKLSYGPLRRLHRALIAPLRDHLPAGEAVFLAPFSWLHLVPFGAALDPATEHYTAKDYRLAFVPSLAALRVVVEQARRGGVRAEQLKGRSLLSVAYPGPPDSEYYLQNVLPEAKAVTRHFAQVKPLYEDAATPEAMLENAGGKDVIHIGCHGWFDPEDPEQSGLWLAEGWLTVERIITELHLDRTRLATLSSCLSGRVEVRRGEEHVGLLQGVMSAGARAVITSLWSVNDAATRALFEAFYSRFEAGISSADALTSAARLVRSHRRWEHPYYWAAFQASGLAHGPGEAESEQLPNEVLKRIEEAHHVSTVTTRGGSAMDTEKMVRDGIILLEQMAENPEEVVGALAPAEGERTIEKLRVLEEQSAGVQNEAELLALAAAVNGLVEETPALATLLLPEGMDVGAAQEERRITLEDYGADASESRYVQEYAPQIRNHIVECRKELEEALHELFPEDQGQM